MRRGSCREDARRGARIEPPAAAIVVAAGRGDRARSSAVSTPKQFRPIAGRPAAAWSIEVMVEAGCSPVIVALPPDRMDVARELVSGPHVAFVPGGETRQDSVRNALDAVASDVILVHDGARPLVKPELVHAVISALGDSDAVVPVLPVDDTLKEVEGGRVVRTPDRTRFRRIQTPQAFRAGALRAAHEAALRDGFVATDDAQLVEMNGGRVVTVDGARTNIKLTRPEDFEVAELYMRG